MSYLTVYLASQQYSQTNNLVNYAAIGGVILAVIGAFGAYIRRSIKSSVDNLANVLDERLATKETVADLTTRVAVLEERERFHGI